MGRKPHIDPINPRRRRAREAQRQMPKVQHDFAIGPPILEAWSFRSLKPGVPPVARTIMIERV